MAIDLSLDNHIRKEAARFGVPYDLVRRVIIQESGGTNGLSSTADAKGVMQLIPTTAKAMGVRDIWDPYQNISGGIKYLGQQLREFGNVADALGAYNAGPGRMRGHIKSERQKLLPLETRKYIKSIQGMKLDGKPFVLRGDRPKGVQPPAEGAYQVPSDGSALPPYLNPSDPSVQSAFSLMMDDLPEYLPTPTMAPLPKWSAEPLVDNTAMVALDAPTGAASYTTSPDINTAMQWVQDNYYVGRKK